MKKLTIVIPVKDPKFLGEFMKKNRRYLKKYPVIVVDSNGGGDLKELATVYITKNCTMAKARSLAYSKVETPFVLNLDSDVIIPKRYIVRALALLKKNKDMGAVSIFYKDIGSIGALEYGISIWRTELLRELYDYNPIKLKLDIVWIAPGKYTQLEVPYSEHYHMWTRLASKGLRLGTLPFRARHLRGVEE